MTKTKSRRPARRPRRRPSAHAARSRRPKPRKPAPVGTGRREDSGLAPGMQAINTHLAVANVAATMAFLERAFGFSSGVVLGDTDGQLRYAEMRHGESVVMLIRKGDATSGTSGISALYTYVDDVDRALAQAREAGAGVGEAQDKPWGDRTGVVTDPDGYRWVLATFKKLAPFQPPGPGGQSPGG